MSNPNPPQVEREARTAVWLRVIASVVLMLLIFTGAVRIFSRSGWLEGELYAFLVELTYFTLYLAGGLAAGGLLAGIAALLRVLRDLHSSFIRVERFQYERTETQIAAAETDRPHRNPAAPKTETDHNGEAEQFWREAISLLSDIRANSLLSESERVQKKVRVANEEFQEATTRVQSLIKDGNFAQAREAADQIARKHPDDPRAASLSAEVERARERYESDDVRATTRQVEDLISISAWGRVREIAGQLQQRHPDSTEARQLLLRIEREYRVFEDEQKRRMSAEVQRFVTRRRWEEALAVAKAFIERFPGSEESEGLRMQLPTLEGNAEIELRQRLESQIMDYARNGRYLEALELARRVIDQYPDSPQAEVLRDRLERLEELAENPDAPKARVRMD